MASWPEKVCLTVSGQTPLSFQEEHSVAVMYDVLFQFFLLVAVLCVVSLRPAPVGGGQTESELLKVVGVGLIPRLPRALSVCSPLFSARCNRTLVPKPPNPEWRKSDVTEY